VCVKTNGRQLISAEVVDLCKRVTSHFRAYVTVAMVAQGTTRADAVTQAFSLQDRRTGVGEHMWNSRTIVVVFNVREVSLMLKKRLGCARITRV
jgi:hypothetical protein